MTQLEIHGSGSARGREQTREQRARPDRRRRIVVHDYSGHPFQVQLSRALASRGHVVIHQFCASYVSGRGPVRVLPGDPPTFRIESIDLGGEFQRYSPAKRLWQEIRYGRLALQLVQRSAPDCALISNVPLLAHALMSEGLSRAGVPMVFWHQDVYSAAIGSQARRRLGKAGRLLADTADRIERRIARASDGIVSISDAFLEVYARWGVDLHRVEVIPNWAELTAIRPAPKDNPWSRRHRLHDRKVFLYAGTLGVKHNPAMLVFLSRLGQEMDFVVVVASQGAGRAFLEDKKSEGRLTNLLLLDYQSYEELPNMLGAADVGVVLLEEEASQYSVPSKALTYLAAGLPALAVMPCNNPVAAILEESASGVVLQASDFDGLRGAATTLIGNEVQRNVMALNARRYAEENFEIARIADKFERILLEHSQRVWS